MGYRAPPQLSRRSAERIAIITINAPPSLFYSFTVIVSAGRIYYGNLAMLQRYNFNLLHARHRFDLIYESFVSRHYEVEMCY